MFQCFQRAGLESLDEKCISYRMVEQVMTDFRSCYPNSFDFKQIKTILKLVRDRMDVDTYSRIESHMESYLASTDMQDDGKIDTDQYSITKDYNGLADWLAY